MLPAATLTNQADDAARNHASQGRQRGGWQTFQVLGIAELGLILVDLVRQPYLLLWGARVLKYQTDKQKSLPLGRSQLRTRHKQVIARFLTDRSLT